MVPARELVMLVGLFSSSHHNLLIPFVAVVAAAVVDAAEIPVASSAVVVVVAFAADYDHFNFASVLHKTHSCIRVHFLLPH